MVKQLFLLALIAFYSIDSISQEIVKIPDKNFKEALLLHDPVIDINEDGEIQLTEAQNTSELIIYSQDINDLTGIEFFSNIIYLDCHDNNLNKLNLKNNILLERLDCYNNKIYHLDISNNQSLKYLYCKENQLSFLDVKTNFQLITLNCSNNKLKSLDVSKNKLIESIDYTGNLIVD